MTLILHTVFPVSNDVIPSQAVTAWFYPGQPEVEFMLECPGTVAEAVAAGAEGGAEGAVELVRAIAARAL